MRKVSSFSRIFLARIKIEGILVQDMYGYAQLFWYLKLLSVSM